MLPEEKNDTHEKIAHLENQVSLLKNELDYLWQLSRKQAEQSRKFSLNFVLNSIKIPYLLTRLIIRKLFSHQQSVPLSARLAHYFKRIFSNQIKVIAPACAFVQRYVESVALDVKKCGRKIKTVILREKNLAEQRNAQNANAKNADVTAQLDYTKDIFAQSAIGPENVRISFYAATRKGKNPNCMLESFLKSIVANAHDLACIEVLLAIDKDDDLFYFQALKLKYDRQFRFRIFISDIRHGYEGLHKYDTVLFKQASPNTKMFCDYSDDCQVTLKHFDKQLLEIDAAHADNIYFIHTRDTKREVYLGDVSEHQQLLYWILQAKEPASYFPIISKRVVDIAFDYAASFDSNKEWSPIANTWICDCYVDIISNYIKKLGKNRIYQMDMIEMNLGILSPHQYPDQLTGLTPNNRAFIKMLNNESLAYLQGLARQIRSHVDEDQWSVQG